MRRISVVGNSGSGKTTLARRLAGQLGLTHVELDGIFHQPGWTELPVEEFRARVAARLDALPGGWTTCGNYRAIQEVVWPRADMVVWLDLPRSQVMRQVVSRTFRRVLTREELWNGNREPFENLWAWTPERNIMRWAWTRHDTYVRRYSAAMTDPAWQGLTFVRLRSRAEVEEWIGGMAP